MWVVHKARIPSTGRSMPVVVDEETLKLMPEARDFAIYLAGSGKADTTLKAYVPRVARFLNWAESSAGCNWRTITLKQLIRFQWSLEAPYETASGTRVRESNTVSAIITTVLEFLRFCAREGSIGREVPARFVQPKHLLHMPASFDPGEQGQFRFQLVKELRGRGAPKPPKKLNDDQLARVRGAALNVRERFLIELLDATAIRIGEALGLRRSDMHLLPDSTWLGCEVPGAHVHIERRFDNENVVFTKAKVPRYVPVSRELSLSYAAYRVVREKRVADHESDHVFVNLWGGEVGAAVTYSNIVKSVEALGTRAGVPGLHPHQFRHTTASRWSDSGVDRVVLQELLGHAVAASTEVYLHPSYARLREAVDNTERAQLERRA